MGHPQPPTPIQTDDSTAEGVVNLKVQPKRTKSKDMRFHWLRDREAQQQFRFYWKPGKTNLADYFTKHHTPSHHKNVQSEFLTKYAELRELRKSKTQMVTLPQRWLQGCVRLEYGTYRIPTYRQSIAMEFKSARFKFAKSLQQVCKLLQRTTKLVQPR